MDEGYFDGATNDGIDPEPPSGTEDSSSDAGTEDRPELGQIHRWISISNGSIPIFDSDEFSAAKILFQREEICWEARCGEHELRRSLKLGAQAPSLFLPQSLFGFFFSLLLFFTLPTLINFYGKWKIFFCRREWQILKYASKIAFFFFYTTTRLDN